MILFNYFQTGAKPLCVLINMDKWKSLSPAQQKVIEMGVAQHAENMHSWMMEGSFDPKYSQHFEFGGLSAEDSQRLRDAAQVLWKEEAAKSERNKKAIAMLEEMAKNRK